MTSCQGVIYSLSESMDRRKASKYHKGISPSLVYPGACGVGLCAL